MSPHVETLQQLLNNVIELDPMAKVVCSIGNSAPSTLHEPMFYLSTHINRMDGFVSCSIACHADTPIGVMVKFQQLLIAHNAKGGTFSINRRVFTADDSFNNICFK